MGRRDELLDKAVAGSLTQAEATELRSLIQKEDMDARLKALVALGVGAAAGATLPKLLELDLDLFGDLLGAGPAAVEVAPEEQPQAGAPVHHVQPGTEQFEPENPEEEALEVAREATGLEQVGARPMYAPRATGEDRQARRRRAAQRR